MPQELAHEVGNRESRSFSGASGKLSHESDRGVQTIGRDEYRQLIEGQNQTLRHAGILPELALEDATNFTGRAGENCRNGQRQVEDASFVLTGLTNGSAALEADRTASMTGKEKETQEYCALRETVTEKVSTYEVEKGDTLWGICKEFLRENNGKEPGNREIYRKVIEVARENGIKNPDRICPGQLIKLRYETKETIPPQDKQTETPPAKTATADSSTKFATSSLGYALDKYSEIDTDKDNRMTGKEIDDYIEANYKTLTVAEERALKQVAKNSRGIESQFEEDGAQGAGMSRQDIETAEKRMKAYEYANKWFHVLDKGEFPGFVCRQEVAQFIDARPDLSEEDLESLEFLRDEMNLIKSKNNSLWIVDSIYPGFTRNDLQAGLNELGCRTYSDAEKFPQTSVST